MSVGRLVAAAAAIVVALLAARSLAAQTVTGLILERTTQTPLSGVVVQLLDSAGRTANQAFTNQQGVYRLATPGAGTYQVRTLRIGFRPATSNPIRIGGEDVQVPPLLTGAAISLDTVRVVGRNRCRAVGDAAATFAIWEQARAALTAVELTGRSRVMDATTVTFQRKLEPGTRRIVEQHANLRRGFTTSTWQSLPVDSLRQVGYVVLENTGWTTYYAPDLDVLLSDAFVTDHCFRVASEAGTGLVGIEFEPTRDRRGVAGIRGTIWVNRATSELHSMDFRYTNVSTAEERASAGGEMQFARMANGAWLISRWTIRMPVLETRYVAASGVRSRARIPETIVSHLRVEGGAVALVTQRADTLWAGAPLTLAGAVVDSTSGAATPGALLSLRGTGRQAVSDSTGRFRFTDLLPGDYTLDVRTTRLAALGALHSVPVPFTDSATQLIVRVPDAAAVARAQCGEQSGGMVAGGVYVTGEASPRPNALVVAEWDERRLRSETDPTQGMVTRTRWLEVRSDARGNYRFCGAPVNTQMTLRARTDSLASQPIHVQLADNLPLVTADITIDRPVADNATLYGVILADFNGAPILDAEVALPSLSRTTFTDADGAYRITDIPSGTHRVQVRRIGWQPRSLDVAFAPGQMVERRLLLSQVQVMDTVAVTASYLPRDFEDHRRQGLGRFITAEQLERFRGLKLDAALRSLPGLNIATSATGPRAWIKGGRGASILGVGCVELEGMSTIDEGQGRNCGCFAQVYLDGMRLYGGAGRGIVPDINMIPPESIEAIEFYVGAAQTPMKYATLNSNCGVLVIHTRRYRRDDPR